MDTEDLVNNILEHHGVKGMHWGVRKDRGGGSSSRKSSTSHPTSEDAAKAHASHTKAKSHGTNALSNQELQHLVNRMNLEQQYSRLHNSNNSSRLSAGKKFTKDVLANVAKQQVTALAAKGATKLVAKALV